MAGRTPHRAWPHPGALGAVPRRPRRRPPQRAPPSVLPTPPRRRQTHQSCLGRRRQKTPRLPQPHPRRRSSSLLLKQDSCSHLSNTPTARTFPPLEPAYLSNLPTTQTLPPFKPHRVSNPTTLEALCPAALTATAKWIFLRNHFGPGALKGVYANHSHDRPAGFSLGHACRSGCCFSVHHHGSRPQPFV